MTARTQPLAIDLFCGLGGWTEGLLAEGYRVVGFDIERHVYGNERYPAQLVIQDVLTLHGSQFKDAALIVASPPCQAYSYRSMPWKRAKALPPPDNSLFEACFRIQAEAIRAAGHHIPLVVENVRGAQPYVGRSKFHFGSFHLWGDVPALMPVARKAVQVATMGAGWYPPGHPKHVPGLAFNGHAERAIRSISEAHRSKSPGMGYGSVTDDGIKHHVTGAAWFDGAPDKMLGHMGPAKFGSKSKARKRASAMIAKIPLVLSRHIARAWKPDNSFYREV